jgi:hypothetical protein
VKLSRAKYVVQTVEIFCPYCAKEGTEATIFSPGGSSFWEVAEIGEHNFKHMVCSVCKKRSESPRVNSTG